MRKYLILGIILFGIIGFGASSNATVTQEETETYPVLDVESKVPIKLIDITGQETTLDVTITYRSEDLIRIDRAKTVVFTVEMPEWEKPFFINKVWKSQIILGSSLQGLIVDEGKITVNQFHRPVVTSVYNYESYSTFRPFEVTAGEEICHTWGYSSGVQFSNKNCDTAQLDLAISPGDESFKAHIGVMLIWEMSFMIPVWNASEYGPEYAGELEYERTITDRFCVEKENNTVIPRNQCGVGVSLDKIQDELQTYTEAAPGFEFLVVLVALPILALIYRKKRRN
jgi:hypothetical protein